MSYCNTARSIEKIHLLKTLEVMHLTRFMDDKMSKLVRQNKGATFHLPVAGHEMIGALSALSLIPGTDWAYPETGPLPSASAAVSRISLPLF